MAQTLDRRIYVIGDSVVLGARDAVIAEKPLPVTVGVSKPTRRDPAGDRTNRLIQTTCAGDDDATCADASGCACVHATSGLFASTTNATARSSSSWPR